MNSRLPRCSQQTINPRTQRIAYCPVLFCTPEHSLMHAQLGRTLAPRAVLRSATPLSHLCLCYVTACSPKFAERAVLGLAWPSPRLGW